MTGNDDKPLNPINPEQGYGMNKDDAFPGYKQIMHKEKSGVARLAQILNRDFRIPPPVMKDQIGITQKIDMSAFMMDDSYQKDRVVGKPKVHQSDVNSDIYFTPGLPRIADGSNTLAAYRIKLEEVVNVYPADGAIEYVAQIDLKEDNLEFQNVLYFPNTRTRVEYTIRSMDEELFRFIKSPAWKDMWKE